MIYNGFLLENVTRLMNESTIVHSSLKIKCSGRIKTSYTPDSACIINLNENLIYVFYKINFI